MAVSGGELAVTGRTYRPTLQCRDLPTDGRTDYGKDGLRKPGRPTILRTPIIHLIYIYKALYSIYTESSKTTQHTLKTQPILYMHLAECRSNHVLGQHFARYSQKNGATESKRLAVLAEHTTFAHDNRSAVPTLTIVLTSKNNVYAKRSNRE